MLCTKDTVQIKRHTQTEMKEMEKYISCKWKQNKAHIEILISDKIDLKIQTIE